MGNEKKKKLHPSLKKHRGYKCHDVAAGKKSGVKKKKNAGMHAKKKKSRVQKRSGEENLDPGKIHSKR